jgi:Phage capsid family
VPKVQTGATVGVQTDGGAISDTDITDNFVTAPVRTLAGQQDIAMQLLDQSPVAFDEIMMQDLLADYARVIDLQCWQGTGANGQLLGVDNVPSTNAVTYTSGSPSITGLYPILGQAISQLAKNRKRADGISWYMQAPRWYWIASSLDSQNRPFIIPMDQGASFNPLATQLDLAAEGPIGRIFGASALLDMNITTVDGVGTNQDRMYPIRTQDLYLFEGQMRTRALTEVLSGTLQVRIQVYNYVALLSTRYPQSISVITGTGLVNPTGF